ncbi:MAG TPA: phage tail tube protein [Candidatus Acidoferrales bacterium]
MSNSIAARGSKLQRSPDNSTFTTIAEVLKINGSGGKSDLADVTNMDSPSNFREKLPTLLDSGDVSFDCNWIPGNSTQTQLTTDFNNQTLLYWKILLPNGTNGLSFQGYVTDKNFDLPIDKQASKSLKLTITGPITEF